MGAAKRRIHRSQCFTIFTGTGSFAWMEQLRRSPIRSPCDAVLFRWQPVFWFVWKSADCLGGNGADRKQRRPEVLELVWVRQPSRMVCLFCELVCRTKWNGCIWTSIEVFKLCCRSKLVSGTRKMERKRLYTIRRRLYLF